MSRLWVCDYYRRMYVRVVVTKIFCELAWVSRDKRIFLLARRRHLNVVKNGWHENFSPVNMVRVGQDNLPVYSCFYQALLSKLLIISLFIGWSVFIFLGRSIFFHIIFLSKRCTYKHDCFTLYMLASKLARLSIR